MAKKIATAFARGGILLYNRQDTTVLKRLKSMPPGTRLLLAVFLFTAAYSAVHLVKGIALLNVRLIIGGAIFTAVSIPLVLICWHSHSSDGDGADKPTDRDKRR